MWKNKLYYNDVQLRGKCTNQIYLTSGQRKHLLIVETSRGHVVMRENMKLKKHPEVMF